MFGDLQRSSQPPHQPVPQSVAPRSRTVIVRGFDSNLVSEHELVEHFQKVGTVERLSVVRREAQSRDHAFVDYTTADAAERAVAGLNFSKLQAHSHMIFELRVSARRTSACAAKERARP